MPYVYITEDQHAKINKALEDQNVSDLTAVAASIKKDIDDQQKEMECYVTLILSQSVDLIDNNIKVEVGSYEKLEEIANEVADYLAWYFDDAVRETCYYMNEAEKGQ